jgi:hypothetical protein
MTLSELAPSYQAEPKYIRDFKVIDNRSSRHPGDSEQLRSVPRTQPAFAGTVDCNGGIPLEQKGARHERHDLEGGPGEAGPHAAVGHRMGDGLCNRDDPTRTSVGKRSGVSPRVHRASVRRRAMREPAYELMEPLTEVCPLGAALTLHSRRRPHRCHRSRRARDAHGNEFPRNPHRR